MLKFDELKLKHEEKEATIYSIFKSSLGDTFASDIRTIENDPANNTDKRKTYAIIALMNAKTAATRDAINANLNNELIQLPVVTKHKTAHDTLILFNYFNELYCSNNNNTLYPFDTLRTTYLSKLDSNPGSETSMQRETIMNKTDPRQEKSRQENLRQENPRQENSRQEISRQENPRQENSWQESSRQKNSRQEDLRQENSR